MESVEPVVSEGCVAVEGGVCAPQGFLASGVYAGIRSTDRADVALVAATEAVPTAALFTTNLVVAAPVVVSREHVADGRVRAVAINAGNANAATGDAGLAAARDTARAVGEALGCAPTEVLVGSTGVIGVPLPVERLIDAIPAAVEALSTSGGADAAQAIMTTDTFAKEVAVRCEIGGRMVTVGGMAKGSGMICPNMATMLAVLTTDAPLEPSTCDALLRAVVGVSFNRVTVDADTSTNDMCVLMASGKAGGTPFTSGSDELVALTEVLTDVAVALARSIARDGEGATRLVSVTVTGAPSDADAERCARTIGESPLVKTAVFGHDANWGRVAAAAGRSGVVFDPSRLSIDLLGIPVCRDGMTVPFDEGEALRRFDDPEVAIDVDLGAGDGAATVWTCDLSYDYVRINGDYRT